MSPKTRLEGECKACVEYDNTISTQSEHSISVLSLKVTTWQRLTFILTTARSGLKHETRTDENNKQTHALINVCTVTLVGETQCLSRPKAV